MSDDSVQEGTARIRSRQGSAAWRPQAVPDGVLEQLLNTQLKISEEAKTKIRQAAFEVLAQCGDPSAIGSSPRTGLVVGYVQSGKTLSFTTVAAAAIDNGYRTVVVLGGSSLPLSEQNADRLEEDLAVLAEDESEWEHRHNPTASHAEELRGVLESPLQQKALLITAMKHQKHTRSVSELLQQLGKKAEPILIIDDEADHVSLNGKARKRSESEQTRNYEEICGLRAKNPGHVYLQYTATPQGPVLISVLDRLAPDFGVVLEPGAGYLGGKQIFVDAPDDFVRQIPIEEDRLARDEDVPPDSLYDALAIYFLGVAQWWHLKRDLKGSPPKHLSMMIHADQRVQPSQKYAGWVRQFVDRVKLELKDDMEPNRAALITRFRSAYEDLTKTDASGNLGSFDRLLELVGDSVGLVKIQEFRGNRKPDKGWKKAWKSSKFWILIGGQLLDRGFTVEGLAVTYMPRPIGGGQADTIQQRARFFGYKQSYRSLCRVFLTKIAQNAYEHYVEHEESLRRFINVNKDQLGSRDTIRRFRLDRSLRPTRSTVLTQEMRRAKRQSWFYQTWVTGREHSPSSFSKNGDVIKQFSEAISPEVQGRGHIRFDTTVGELYDSVLTTIVLAEKDQGNWEVLLLEIEGAVQSNPAIRDKPASIIKMRSSGDDSGPSRRTLDNTGTRIPTVPVGPTKDKSYAGDREEKSGVLTLQVHEIVVSGEPEDRILPIIGLWCDETIRNEIVIQDQSESVI